MPAGSCIVQRAGAPIVREAAVRTRAQQQLNHLQRGGGGSKGGQAYMQRRAKAHLLSSAARLHPLTAVRPR